MVSAGMERLKMKIQGEISHDSTTHSYCPNCWSENIIPYDRQGKEYYKCNYCGYDDSRLIVIYPQMRWRILDDKELLHFSVGCVLHWNEKILLFRRRLFPFKYTIVAGHWDLNDPTPELAIIREVKEETGLEIVSPVQGFVETLNEPCRRGADYHEWHLFTAVVDSNKVVLPDEGDIMGWYSPEEIEKLELTVPAEHFLKKLKIISA